MDDDLLRLLEAHARAARGYDDDAEIIAAAGVLARFTALRAFAARIRAETIEECACLCDIREREYSAHTSQTNRGAAIGAAYCAAAIRALGGRKPQ